MLRVPVHKIEPGMVLARPIPLPTEPRRFLLQRDREIPMDLVPRLRQLGVMEVWIRHRDLEFLEDIIDEGLGEHQQQVYSHVRKNFESIIRGSSMELDVVHFQESIGELFAFLKENSGSNVLLQKLDAFDNYLMSHSTNTCYLSLLLGMKLEGYLIEERSFKSARDAKQLHLLGLGSLLHDVGKLQVPREILDKPGKLTDEEMAEIQRHPRYGYDLVRGSLPAAAAEIVLNHHQRFNGSGYPGRFDAATGEHSLPPLGGRQIPIFSRIAVMADIYDAATSRRCYSEAKLPVRVLHEMRQWCEGFFDPVVEDAFHRTVPAFPIGQLVTLSDGFEAVVVDFNPDYAVRPKVQCLRDPNGQAVDDPALEEIDLALYPELEIASVDGEDVRPYTASQQPVGTIA